MSTLVDEKIVSMKFDSAQFERGVQSAIQSTNNLKKSLNFDDTAASMSELSRAAGRVDMNPLLDSIRSIGDSFNAAGIVAFSVINRMTNAAIDAGVKITKALTITPMTSGMNEYELKMGSIQTIMAATGADIKTINGYLDQLNEYSDRTIYSFADMTQNIGKFTNAGVKLDVAVDAMRGLMNEAALSGATAAEASRAMYNLAQSISMGYVQLIDWKSIENANMATIDFKRNLAATAESIGQIRKVGDDVYAVGKKTYTIQQLFKDGLQEQWLTTEVLTSTLRDYQDESEEALQRTGGLATKAYAAAQDLKTFTQMVDTLKEALQSGWAQSWQLIFGDFVEAKKFWTTIGTALNQLIGQIDSFRNKALEIANTLGMRENLLKSFMNLMTAFGQILYVIKEAADEAFGSDTFKGAKSSMSFFASVLLRISEVIEHITEKLIMNKDTQQDLITIFTAMFSVIKLLWGVTEEIYDVIAEIFGISMPLGKFLRKLVVILAKIVIIITTLISKTKIISGTLKLIAAGIGLVVGAVALLISKIIDLFSDLPSIESILNGIGDAILKVHDALSNSSSPIIRLLEKAFIAPFYLIWKVWQNGFYDIGKLPQLLIKYFSTSFATLRNAVRSWFNNDSFEMFAPIKSLFIGLAEFIGKFNWAQALKAGGLIYLLTFITTMVVNITKLIDVFYSFGSTIRVLGKALGDVMNSMANFINAQAFDMFTNSMKKIAIVVAAMGGLSLVFGLLKEDAFNRAMVALERLALVIGTVTAVIMSIFYIMKTINTIGTATSVNSFADALAAVGKSFAAGAKVAMQTYTRGLAMQHLLFGIAAAMVAIAASFGIITDALLKVDPSEINAADVILTSLWSLTGAMTVLTLVSKFAGTSDKLLSMSMMLLTISGSIMLLAEAFEAFSRVDQDAMTLGLTTVTAVAGIATVMTVAASKFPADYRSILSVSVLLVSFSGALMVLCESMEFVHNAVASGGLGRVIVDIITLNLMMGSFAAAIIALSFSVRGFSSVIDDSTSVIATAADALSALGMSAVILSMAAAILVLTEAVQVIGKTDVTTIQNGLYYMTIILSEFALFVFVITRTVASSLASAGGYFLGIALIIPSIAFAIERIQDIDWARATADIAAMSLAIIAMGASIRLAAGVDASKNIKTFAGMSLAIAAISISLIALTYVNADNLWKGAVAFSASVLSVGLMFDSLSKIRSDRKTLIALGSIVLVLASIVAAGKLASDPKTLTGIFAISMVSTNLLWAMSLFSIAVAAMADIGDNTIRHASTLMAAVSLMMLSVAASAAIIKETGAQGSILVVLGATVYLSALTVALTEYAKLTSKGLSKNEANKLKQQMHSIAVVIASMSVLALSLSAASKLAKGNMTTIIQLGLVMSALTVLMFAISAFMSKHSQFKASKNDSMIDSLKSIGLVLLAMSAVMTVITGAAAVISHYNLIDEVCLLAVAFGVLGAAVAGMMIGVTKTKRVDAKNLTALYSIIATMILVASLLTTGAVVMSQHEGSMSQMWSLVAACSVIAGVLVALGYAIKDLDKAYFYDSKEIVKKLVPMGVTIGALVGAMSGITIAFEKFNVSWGSVGRISTVTAVAFAILSSLFGFYELLFAMSSKHAKIIKFDLKNKAPKMEIMLKGIWRILAIMGASLSGIVAASVIVGNENIGAFSAIAGIMPTLFAALTAIVYGIIRLTKTVTINDDTIKDIAKFAGIISVIGVVMGALTAGIVVLSKFVPNIGEMISTIAAVSALAIALSGMTILFWAVGELMTAGGGIGAVAALAGAAAIVASFYVISILAYAMNDLVGKYKGNIAEWAPFIENLSYAMLMLGAFTLLAGAALGSMVMAIAGLVAAAVFSVVLNIFLGAFSYNVTLFNDQIESMKTFAESLKDMMLSLAPVFVIAAGLSLIAGLATTGLVSSTITVSALMLFLLAFSAVKGILDFIGIDSKWIKDLIDFAKNISVMVTALLPAFTALTILGLTLPGVLLSVPTIISGFSAISLLILTLAGTQVLANKFSGSINWLADWIIDLGDKFGDKAFSALNKVGAFLTNLSKANLFKLIGAAFVGAAATKIFRIFTGKGMLATIGEELSSFAKSMQDFVRNSNKVGSWEKANLGLDFLKNVIDAVSNLRLYDGSLFGKIFGTNDLEKLAEGLSKYAESMFGDDGYVTLVSHISKNVFDEDSSAVKAINFLKTITDAMYGFKWTSGSVMGTIFGSNDFSDVGYALNDYVTGMYFFAQKAGKISEDQYPAMERALSFLPKISMASLLSWDTSNTLFALLIGHHDFGHFGESLRLYGSGLLAYSKIISGISNWVNMDKGIDFLVRLSTLTLEIALNTIKILGAALVVVVSAIAASILIIFYAIDAIVTSHQKTFDKIIDNCHKLLENGLQEVFDLLNKTIGDTEWVKTTCEGITMVANSFIKFNVSLIELIKTFEGFSSKVVNKLESWADSFDPLVDKLDALKDKINELLETVGSLSTLSLPSNLGIMGPSEASFWGVEIGESIYEKGSSFLSNIFGSKEEIEDYAKESADTYKEAMATEFNNGGGKGAGTELASPYMNPKMLEASKLAGIMNQKSFAEGESSEAENSREAAMRKSAEYAREQAEKSAESGSTTGQLTGNNFISGLIGSISSGLQWLSSKLPKGWKRGIEGFLGMDEGDFDKGVSVITDFFEKWKNEGFGGALDGAGESIFGFLGLDPNDPLGLGGSTDDPLGLNGNDDPLGLGALNEDTKEKEKERLLSENQYWADLLEIRKNGADGWKYQDMELADFQQQILNETQSMYDNYLSGIENSYDSFLGSDIFGAVDMGFDPENPFTKDEMFQNLQDQIYQLDRYTEVMNSLNDRIDTDELRATINAMGVDSIEELETLNSLSEAELDSYEAMYVSKMESAHRAAVAANDQSYRDTVDGINKLLGTSLDGDAIMQMFDGTMASLDNIVAANQVKMASIGTDINAGIAEGMTSKDGMAVIDAAAIILDDGIENYTREHLKSHSPAQRMVPVGEDAVKGISVGMTDSNSMTSIKASSALVVAWYESEIKSKRAGFFNSGVYLMRGLTEGIESGKEGVLKAIERFSGKIKSTFQTDQEMHSPSEVWIRFGKYIDEGLAIGILNNTGNAENAIHQMSLKTFGIMQDAMSSAYDAMNSESVPAITPVVNMNKLQNGLRNMDTALAAQRSYLMANAANASIDTSVHKEVSINNQAAVDAITRLNGDILNLGDRLANMQIMLDTGIVAGQMAPAMNSELGTLMSRSIREGVG